MRTTFKQIEKGRNIKKKTRKRQREIKKEREQRNI